MQSMWTPDLSVGISAIDDQHKKLFEKAGQLFEAGKAGQGREFIAELLLFLEDYTKKHFADEEAYMQKIRYPEYNAQKQMHEGFIRELANLKSAFEKSGGNITVILNANQMVSDWLIRHISGEDKKIGRFAASQGKD